ncbi:unnamed protein product [Caenorhabditis nigoni]|uniref:DUF281 domain-containing protein n=1 Tax=Caenorhabditis nigoni TaxID=1611254 RepID=A0A2G5T8I6_9PELO|nr:hypothetical protein B9Z55_017235 [Caenorhabditis nigoni]
MNIFGFLVFFCLLAKVSAKCADSCECPEFSTLRPSEADASEFQFTQLAGCAANATCVNPNNFVMQCLFTDTEIPQPLGASYVFRIATAGRNFSIPASSFDVFSYFGIICENGLWYATKYPMGIGYTVEDPDTSGITYTNYVESYDGMKSKILGFICNYNGI